MAYSWTGYQGGGDQIAMHAQANFFDVLPDTEWVVTKGHRVYPDGTLFLVVRRHDENFQLCWRDGIQPPSRVLGTLIRDCYLEQPPTH